MTSKTNDKHAKDFIKDDQVENIINTVSSVSDDAVDKSREVVAKSVQVAKEYPIHTAVGVGAVGFLVGLATSKLLGK